MIDRAFLIAAGCRQSGAYLASFKDFPPRQQPACFTIDQVMEQSQRIDEGALMTKALIAYRSCCGWRAASVSLGPDASSPIRPRRRCAQKGGTLQIEQRPDGGQYGVCVFTDNRQCEEWALFRVECPAGGCGSPAT